LQNKELFVDDSFPPTLMTLYYNPADMKDDHVTQWLRPHQISMEEDGGLEWAVFRTPKPSDISQGKHPKTKKYFLWDTALRPFGLLCPEMCFTAPRHCDL